MIALVLGAIAVPLLDLGAKQILGGRLRRGPIGLGPLGELRLVPARIWVARLAGLPLAAILTLWIGAAGALVTGAALAGAPPWCAGLLVGGALSHLLETARRGRVDDWVCLRFWPPFDLADVALAAGALGLLLELPAAIRG